MRSSPQRRRYSNDSSQQQQQQQHYQSSSKSEMKSSLLTMDDEQQQHNWTMFRNMMDDDEDYQQLSKHSNVDRNDSQLVDTIINAATVCNSLMSDYCGLCTFYLDRQVQYELITKTALVLPSSTFDGEHEECSVGSQRRQMRLRNVTEAAMMLFDEESVVASVSSR
jgi:hypothetical protein